MDAITRNRMAKTEKLLAALKLADPCITADQIAGLTTEQWAMAAAIAGCKPPSADTIDMAVKFRQIEIRTAAMSVAELFAPFKDTHNA